MQLCACFAAVASFLATVLYDSTVFVLRLWQPCYMKLISFIQHGSYSTAAIAAIQKKVLYDSYSTAPLL